jgi:hypothetical protein
VVHPDSKGALLELALNRWYRPQLAVIGAAGLPSLSDAGNVLRPSTTLCLSIRLPPAVDPEVAASALKDALTKDAPHGAQASFTVRKKGAGWAAPQQADWLKTACEKASATVFGKPPVMIGEGGSIPFMGMLGKMYPYAQFLVTGVLGPGSNAHGPNERLHLAYVAKLTAGVAHVLVDHCNARVEGSLPSAARQGVGSATEVCASLFTPNAACDCSRCFVFPGMGQAMAMPTMGMPAKKQRVE